MAAIAAGCALVFMGVVDQGGDRRAQAAGPTQGWQPLDQGALTGPARRPASVPLQAGAGAERGGPAAPSR